MSNHHHKLAKELVDFHRVVYKIMGPACLHRVLVAVVGDEERGICLFDGFQVLARWRLKIPTVMTGLEKFLHLLRIFGLLRWNATHL